MSDHTPKPVDRYSYSGNRTVRESFLRRNAAQNAAFFLPYLKPGISLLDCGCGPGSITLGLAKAVAPGEVVGVDIDTDALQIAQENAAKEDVVNLRFEPASAYELPFPDSSFDAVFSHALLVHLREPVRALQEMRRVLKPGGLVAIRNDDIDGLLISPADPLLYETWELLAKTMESNGGNARGAKHSRAWLHQAGFTRIVASASCESMGTTEETLALSNFMLSNARDRNSPMSVAWQAWGERPDSFLVRLWCEAIGWVE